MASNLTLLPGMPDTPRLSHALAAEAHDHAARAHRLAAQHHALGEHEAALDFSGQAEAQARNAVRLSRHAHSTTCDAPTPCAPPRRATQPEHLGAS